MTIRFVFTLNLIFLMLILGLPIAQNDEQPNKLPAVKAFPTAEGFGAKSRGGRGGRIIEITNLNDSGAGSLRQALEVENGPRIVVFRVSGTIELTSDIRIQEEKGSFVTIAGQTSPGGVQLKGDGLMVMNGAHDVVLRYLRIRPGAHLPVLRDTNGFIAWGSNGKPVYNIIVDHCSLQWSTDQNGPDAWHWVTNYTSQWNIIAEGTTKGHEKGRHSMGILVGGRTAEEKLTMSIHHCLLAHNGGRNPLIGNADVVDFRNNIVYNWGGNNAANWGSYIGNQSAFGNIVNNHYIAGPNSSTANIYWLENGGPTRIDGAPAERGGTKIFMEGNLGPNCRSQDADDWSNGVFNLDYWKRDGSSHFPEASQTQFRAATPFVAPAVTTVPTQELKSAILPTVGGSKPFRDAVDARIVFASLTDAWRFAGLTELQGCDGCHGQHRQNRLRRTLAGPHRRAAPHGLRPRRHARRLGKDARARPGRLTGRPQDGGEWIHQRRELPQ